MAVMSEIHNAIGAETSRLSNAAAFTVHHTGLILNDRLMNYNALQTIKDDS